MVSVGGDPQAPGRAAFFTVFSDNTDISWLVLAWFGRFLHAAIRCLVRVFSCFVKVRRLVVRVWWMMVGEGECVVFVVVLVLS